MASTILRVAAVAAVAFALAAAPAAAYTESPVGTYNVTTAELQAEFGAGVDVTKVEFEVVSNVTWYSVPCKKTVGHGRVLTKTFKRQSHTSAVLAVTPTASGVTLVTTGTTTHDNARCPRAFAANGDRTVLRQDATTHVAAEYGDMDAVLTKT